MSKEGSEQNGLHAAETVRNFLVEMEMNPVQQQLGDSVLFYVAFDGPADQGIAQIFVTDERFVFYFVFSGYVAAGQRHKVAEFISRANWKLIEGCFLMDFDTGALRYRVGIDFTSTELAEQLVRNALLSGMNAVDLFIGDLVAVIEGGLEPADALKNLPLKPDTLS